MKVKRYMVFGSAAYYPSGGWRDFVNSFDTEAEAVACADELKQLSPEIIDLEIGEDIYIYPKHRNAK